MSSIGIMIRIVSELVAPPCVSPVLGLTDEPHRVRIPEKRLRRALAFVCGESPQNFSSLRTQNKPNLTIASRPPGSPSGDAKRLHDDDRGRNRPPKRRRDDDEGPGTHFGDRGGNAGKAHQP